MVKAPSNYTMLLNLSNYIGYDALLIFTFFSKEFIPTPVSGATQVQAL